ncbi:MAG: hypothetical protein WAR79_07445 [Melioribacteraceae bacterium]
MNLIEKQNNGTLFIDPSNKIKTELTEKEVTELLTKLDEEIEKDSSLNLNMWSLNFNNKEIYGLLDSRAGPNEEDLLRIIFSEEF